MKSGLVAERLVALLKCLLAAYLITGILLVVVAGLLYKFSLGENVVDVGIIVVYCLSSLLAGLFFSKGAMSRRFLWGMAAGAVYFFVICAVTFVVEGQIHLMSSSCITTLFICTGSGMLGGMLG